MKLTRSKGAHYITKPRKQPAVCHVPDGTPKLLWTTERSVFVAANGEQRDLYELSKADAMAMCRVYGVTFSDQSKGVDWDAIFPD